MTSHDAVGHHRSARFYDDGSNSPGTEKRMGKTTSRKSTIRGVRKSQAFVGGFPAHPGLELNENDDLESAIGNLFMAYDLDESGELSRDEFVKIEMRMCFERGEVFKEDLGPSVQFSIMDRDRSGNLDFLEFRERQLSWYQSSGLPRAEIIADIKQLTKAILLERARMGPRYHRGIRQMLKKIFRL